MSSYLGRLVDRAVGPPVAGVAPRLAPVFPLGRAAPPEPEPVHGDTVPNGAEAQSRQSPPAERRHSTPETPRPSGAKPEVASPPATRVESQARETRPEPVASIEAASPEPSRVETRVHDRTVEGSPARIEVEPTKPAKAPTLAAPRVARDPVPLARRGPTPAQESPRIEVRIGRVEVRRPAEPDPIEWPAPAANAQPVSGFGELAASRRYVDRRWS